MLWVLAAVQTAPRQLVELLRIKVVQSLRFFVVRGYGTVNTNNESPAAAAMYCLPFTA